MIQATDLRLGNLVMDDEGIVMKVAGLKTKEYSEESDNPYCIILENRGIHYESDIIQPIPITEEWLMKFAFWKQESNWFAIKYSTDCQEASEVFCISYNLNSKRLSFNEEGEDGMVYAGYKIQYVHELQNLYYALTKTELEL